MIAIVSVVLKISNKMVTCTVTVPKEGQISIIKNGLDTFDSHSNNYVILAI